MRTRTNPFTRTSTRRPTIGLLTGLSLLAVLSLLAAACGSSSATDASELSDSAASETTASSVTDTSGDSATASTSEVADDSTAAEGLRVVSLSPTHTEMMYAIGAGDLLVAVDEFSNYPAETASLPNTLSAYEPNVEAIVGFEPDLVLIGGDFNGLGDQLTELGIEFWDGPAAITISDTYTQIEQLGSITDHIAEAAELVSSMQTRIDALVASTPTPETPLSFYHELDPTLYSIDSSTFLGELYTLLGLVNVADGDESESFGYPQLNAEFLVAANPDLIFLADTKCCAENAETVAARPAWDGIAAVQNGNVFEMDDDIASRWGPRVVDYLEAVAAAIEQASVAA